MLSVSGARLSETKELADNVFRRRLEQLEGVAQVTVAGGVEREIVVEVNQKPVTSVGDVTEAVSAAKEEGRPAVLFKVADQAGAEHFVAVRIN